MRFRGPSRRSTLSRGGIYANELFADERGDATLFLPVIGEFRPVGRVGPMSVPGAELAVITHSAFHDDLDRSYGALATYVSEHALAVDGLIRECYLVGPNDTDDESAWSDRDRLADLRNPTPTDMAQRTHDDVASRGPHHQEASRGRRRSLRVR